MDANDDFAAWYAREHPRVLGSLTVVVGSTDLAADATDEAFVRAYQRWSSVAAMDSPTAWLYRVALNVARSRLRRAAVEQRILLRHRPANDVPPPALPLDVWSSVRALPPRQRTAVALRYVLDLPEAEIAQVMGVARGTVSATLTAARRTLATQLADHYELTET